MYMFLQYMNTLWGKYVFQMKISFHEWTFYKLLETTNLVIYRKTLKNARSKKKNK